MNAPDVWEHGSEFHLLDLSGCVEPHVPWRGAGLAFGSGRDALRALLRHGKSHRGWRRLWVPSYFCQEVAAAFLSTELTVKIYPDNPIERHPGWESIAAQPGDVIFRVNYFGLRDLRALASGRLPGVEIIDDHTHDPWSVSAVAQVADWCVASLRKTLPIPDGGMLWSPLGHDLPLGADLSHERRAASLTKLAAMTLKRFYLDGRDIRKATFRDLFQAAEAQIGDGPISGMSPWADELIRSFPIVRWREARRDNHAALCDALAGMSWATVLRPADDSGTCPFSAVIVFDSAERCAATRKRLIENRVYPAVLWPLEDPVMDGVRDCDMVLSRKLLCLHCDMRYGSADMARVAALLLQAGAE